MNRRKSYFGPSVVLVVAAYVGLFYWARGFSFSSPPEPLPEGAAMEWVELSEPSAGQPEPSSSPLNVVDAAQEVPATQPPAQVAVQPEPPSPQQVEPAPTPEPPTVTETTPAPPSPEEMKEAWTAPDSEIPVVQDEEPPLESYAHDFSKGTEPENSWTDTSKSVEESQSPDIMALSDSDFLEPEQLAAETPEELQAESSVTAASASSLKDAPIGNSAQPEAASTAPAFSNPFVDPNAPPVGRHGVLDARSLTPSGGNPPPSYPVSDRLARREGEVVLLGYVTSDGRLSRVTVEKEASSAMTQESYRSFKAYKYRPGQTGWVRQTFRFTLRGQPQEMKATLRGSR